ncbi:hypothetical protein DYB36_012561, partial [Aphanomyces astaci]
VGPIPIDDDQGKEVILRFDTSIQSETWNLTLHNEEEKVAANYVPITIATTNTVEFANQNKTTTQGLTVRGSIALSVGPVHSAMEFLRVEMHQRHLDALVAVTKLNPQLHLPSNPSVAPRLPRNVGLTSMQIVASTSCLVVRLTHLFSIHEHPI